MYLYKHTDVYKFFFLYTYVEMHLYRGTLYHCLSVHRIFHARNVPLSLDKQRFELVPQRDFFTCPYIYVYK